MDDITLPANSTPAYDSASPRSVPHRARRRVVVTGIGAVTPMGSDAASTWQALLEGRSGISKITTFDVEDLPSRIAGTVDLERNGRFSAKEARRMDRFIRFGLMAAEEAMAQAGLSELDDEARERCGTALGSGIGGLPMIEAASAGLESFGVNRVAPSLIPAAIANLAGAQVQMRHGLYGPSLCSATACASGAHSIADAIRAIQTDEADVMVAGGAEGSLCRVGVAAFARARALSTHFNDAPETASRPFDADRDGFVMAEGGAAVVLEALDTALARGAPILAEVVGIGRSCDAFNSTSPHPEGRGQRSAMQKALREAYVDPSEVDLLLAHATSTPAGDRAEADSVHHIFGERLPVTSIKGHTGHMQGASGAHQVVSAVQALRDGLAPGIANLSRRDPELAPITLLEGPRRFRGRYVQINAFAFGGNNVSLLLERHA